MKRKEKIQIGAVFGGPGGVVSKIASVIMRVRRLKQEGDLAESGGLDVVYHVPGSMLSPEFEGVRTGTFSKRERKLQVQIAVPADLLSKGETEMAVFVIRSLREAVRIAAPSFHNAGIAYDVSVYEGIVDRMARAIGPS